MAPVRQIAAHSGRCPMRAAVGSRRIITPVNKPVAVNICLAPVQVASAPPGIIVSR